MKHSLPKHFNHNHIEKFLEKFGDVFHRPEALQKDFELDCSQVNQISVAGILLLYKFMEFTVIDSCYDSPVFKSGKEIEDAIERYGFTELMKEIVRGRFNSKKQKQIFSKINVKLEDNFIIAPHTIQRNESFSNEDFQERYVSKLSEYYKNEDCIEMIFTCISEILLNFWEHAKNDPYSILVAEGNVNKIEIACADTGNGVIETLKSSLSFLNDWPNSKVLNYAIKKDVTSKPNTNHMGRGLWILNEIALQTNGIFQIYSQGAAYSMRNGRETSESCGFWGGTFVYISLPLNNPVTMADVLIKEELDLNKIILNTL